jgi:site-specific DNA recombinase
MANEQSHAHHYVPRWYENVRVENGVVLKVVANEAVIIRRIFELAASGSSRKTIARTLNSECVSPPRPRSSTASPSWCPTAIHAMLRREMYIGKLLWNRSRFLKIPDSNKRVRRLRPQSQWRIIKRPDLAIVTEELWNRVQSRLALTKEIYGRQGRDGLLNRSASSQYLFSGVVKCGAYGGNLVITTGGSHYGHRRYGCSNHFYRGTYANGQQIRKDEMEERLLNGLQKAVTENTALKHVVEEAVRQINEANRRDFDRAATAQETRTKLQAKIVRLVAAVADSGHSAAILDAISQREGQVRDLNGRLSRTSSAAPSVTTADVSELVVGKLTQLRELLNKDVIRARSEMLNHVSEIRFVLQHGTTRSYVAIGEWDLLGKHPEVDRAHTLSGVRARLVAGVGFGPTTSGL